MLAKDAPILLLQAPPPHPGTLEPFPDVIHDLHGAAMTAQEATRAVQEQQRAADVARKLAKATGRPTLSEADVVRFLDWVTVQVVGDAISLAEAGVLLKCAELVISRGHARAQAKPTAHGDVAELLDEAAELAK